MAKHEDAARRRPLDQVGLGALTARRNFGAGAILLAVIGRKAPAADDILGLLKLPKLP
jgi:hypothetical protein